MTKEEIKEILKKELKIEISTDSRYCDGGGCNIKVELLWGENNEHIYSSEDYIYF